MRTSPKMYDEGRKYLSRIRISLPISPRSQVFCKRGSLEAGVRPFFFLQEGTNIQHNHFP